MMRTILLFLCLVTLLTSCYFPKQENAESYKSHFPNENYFSARMFPETSFDAKNYFKKLEKAKSLALTKSQSGEWIDQGPTNIGARVNHLAVHPTNENIIYLAFARGGLFKTTDGGQNWRSIFDEGSYLSVSHIEIDESNPEIVYIGTGDENISHYPAIGNGIYKSEDGGESWTNLGLAETAIISTIHVDKNDGNIIYVSGMGIPFEKTDDRGLYKSIDGGDTWNQVLFVNDSTGIIDMVVAPNNPDLVFAAGWNRLRNNNISKVSGPDAKIHKSEDGGASWTILENGLPEGEFVRIGLAMHGDDGDTVFATYSHSGPSELCDEGGINFYGLYKTSNAGENWNLIPTAASDNPLPCDFQGGFAWYFGKLSVNPNNEDDITLLGVRSHRSLDGGFNWESLTSESDISIHVDNHTLQYIDNDIYLGTDGGAYKETPGDTWSDIESVSTNQFYRVAYNPHNPFQYYGGLQDNGTVVGSGDNIDEWDRIFGGDGFQAQFNADDPDIFYVETQNGNIRITENGGANFNSITGSLEGDANWDMPYFLSPFDQELIITGTDRVQIYHRVIDPYWTAISPDLTDQELDPLGFREHNITTISQSPINEDILYAGTSDGFVWSTLNYGSNWNQINEGLPRRYITEIKASPSFEFTAYLTISGYKNNIFTPYIYRTDDAGITWTPIAGDLPELAINDVYILPGNDDEVIFVATEGGVYYTQDGGLSWLRLGDDFPFIQCLDLEFNPVLNQLIVGTYGRGLQTYDLSQLNISSVSNPTHLSSDFLTIYPNLTRDFINIDWNPTNKAEMIHSKIVNVHGHTVQELNPEMSRLDVSQYIVGTYYIVAWTKEHKTAYKFFVFE